MEGKQRATLRAKANSLNSVLSVGKSGITYQLIGSANAVLKARELIKGSVLETSPKPVAAVAQELAESLAAEVIQVIGSRFVLYRENPELHVQKKAPSTEHVYGRHKKNAKNSVIRRHV